jgi:hypothetical protein
MDDMEARSEFRLYARVDTGLRDAMVLSRLVVHGLRSILPPEDDRTGKHEFNITLDPLADKIAIQFDYKGRPREMMLSLITSGIVVSTPKEYESDKIMSAALEPLSLVGPVILMGKFDEKPLDVAPPSFKSALANKVIRESELPTIIALFDASMLPRAEAAFLNMPEGYASRLARWGRITRSGPAFADIKLESLKDVKDPNKMVPRPRP